MQKHFIRFILVAIACLMWVAVAACARKGHDIQPGDPAPDLALMGSDGSMHGLLDNVGKGWTVIAWFPKAFTSG